MFLKKLKYAFFLLLLASCVFTTSEPVVILIHGSFAVQEPWARPYGDFYQELETQSMGFGLKLVPFSWSGTPTVQELFAAAMRLIRLIESYPEQEEKILIGHSHGGNIINLASRFIGRVDLSPFNEDKLKEIVQSLEDPVQYYDQKRPQNNKKTNDITVPGHPGLSVTPTTRDVTSKKYLFDEVYLLATPVDIVRFKPNMNVIGCLYNFYSTGDLVQTIGGSYDQAYKHDQDGIFNFSIMLKNSGHFGSDYPTHSTIHGPVIGYWILHVPELVRACTGGKSPKRPVGLFENFDGHIYFEAGKVPVYKRA